MRGIFAVFVLAIMLISGAATITLMLYLFGVIGKG
jgi:hypothetical protein